MKRHTTNYSSVLRTTPPPASPQLSYDPDYALAAPLCYSDNDFSLAELFRRQFESSLLTPQAIMCLFITIMLLAGPRAGILIWWLLDRALWGQAFSRFLWPVLGFLFLPWTTLVYVYVSTGGVMGLEWVWLALALFIDISSYAGSGYAHLD